MNKDELNRLLDSVYELEGLIHLALAREDCPEVVPGLILRKAESLPKLAASIIGRRDNQPMQETVTVGIIADEPEYQDPVEMVDDNAVDGNAVDGNAVDDEEDMPECLSMSECLAVTDDFEDDPVAAATDDEPAGGFRCGDTGVTGSTGGTSDAGSAVKGSCESATRTPGVYHQ